MNLSIVCYIDDTSSSKIIGIQEKVSKLTGSRASLSSWEPHITVADGVQVNDDELTTLSGEIRSISEFQPTIKLNTGVFGGTSSRPIGTNEQSTQNALWLEVSSNKELESLVNDLSVITFKYAKWYKMPNPYAPHITIAFRDLSSKGYENGKEFLSEKNIPINLTLSHISLVENLIKGDVEYQRFKFR